MVSPIGLPNQLTQKKPVLKNPATKFGAAPGVNSSQEFNISSLGIPSEANKETIKSAPPKKLTAKEQIENYLNKKFYNPERNANVAEQIAESAENKQGTEKKAYIRGAADNYLRETAPKERPDIARHIQEEARLFQEEENKPLNIKERIETQLNKNSDNRVRNTNLATTITKFALERPAGEQRETYIQEAISTYRNKLTSKENEDFSHLSSTEGKGPAYEPLGFPETKTPKTETPQPAQDTEVEAQAENAPPTDSTGGTEKPEKASESAPASPTPPSDPPKTNNDNKTNNKNENEESGGILKGWKKTKIATGTALLAGGIALKMTLIGIVPGLIMAGAGAALMGWGLLNCIFNGKKDDAKDDKKEGEQKASTTNNS